MQGISTFLWFDNQAAEAARFYVSVFPNSRITGGLDMDSAGPDRDQHATTVSFELDGRPFTALSGGPLFTHSPAISFVISCEDQAEVDYFWERLTDGGEESQCGWLVDPFGVSWQVVPTMLFDVLGGPDPAGCSRAMEAMLQMRKLDIATLQAAYDGTADLDG